ncbi:MAG: branched-chain amino acid ABC transporter permease [Burkholderiales bacterium]|nr:branched-chain amino acid ABC transporter permease [Burkholderiales bacterium]
MTFWLIQTLNGLSFGALLFLLAAGLSLIFGLMRIINLAHGSFYLVGAYVAVAIMAASGSFWLALVVAPLVVAVLSVVLQRSLLDRVVDNELGQVLMTFGFLLVISDASLWIWGGAPMMLDKPAVLEGSVTLAGATFPLYRLALTVAGAVAAVGLWLLVERTRIGAIIRAGVDDAEMVQGTGINLPLAMSLVFALGAFLAGLSGVLAGPILGAYPGADFNVLMLAFAVVVIGGLGSLKGAMIGSLFVGLVDNFGKALVPELAMFTIFVPMVIVLAVRPTGIFGRA